MNHQSPEAAATPVTAPAPAPVALNRDAIETEWQFVTRDLQSLRRRLDRDGSFSGFRVIRQPPLELTDRYLDTSDSRLARAGFALRLRSDGAHCEATLKSLRRSTSGPQQRREITQTLGAATAAALLDSGGPVSERTRAVAGRESLQTLFTARTHRDVYQALHGDRDAAEIVLDQTVLQGAGDQPVGDLQRVEVEMHDASAESLRPLVAELGESGLLQPAAVGKFEAGMEAVGRQLPGAADISPHDFAADTPAAIAGRMMLQRQLAAWQSLEPGVRLADDPEALHQLRVAGRRMVATLRILQAVPVSGAAALRQRVQALLRRLGPARDIDVQLEEIASVSVPTAAALRPVVARLQRERARQQRSLLRVLDARRTMQLFTSLERLSQLPRAVRNGNSIAAVAQQVIRKRYRRLRQAARRVELEATVQHCHDMRLEAKKLRYVAEPLVMLYGEPLQRFLQRLQKLQTLLGRINDAHHARACLESLVLGQRRALSPAAAFALGRLAERYDERIAACGAALPVAWQRVQGRRWRQLRKRLRSVAQPPNALPAPHSAT